MKICKKTIIAALKQQGLGPDQAALCYSVISDLLREALRSGQTIHFQNVVKLYAKWQKPRMRWDSINRKMIYVGEVQKYRHKIFCDHDRSAAAVQLEPVA